MTIKNRLDALSYDVISRWRGELFGILAISIVILHYFLFADRAYDVSVVFQPFIYSWGVDGFMILSGQGLYYSFSKNSNIPEFYKKRVIRLIPSYIIIALIYIIWKNIIYAPDALTFIQDFFFYNSFTQSSNRINTGSWFVATILVFYLLYPFIYKFINNKKSRTIILMCAAVGISLSLCYLVKDESIYRDFGIATDRFAAFIFGSYLGCLSKEKKPVTKKTFIGILMIFPIAAITKIIQFVLERKFDIQTPWFDKIWQGFLAFAIMFAVSFIFDILSGKAELLKKILRFFGAISLELYLCHVEGMRMVTAYIPMEKMNMVSWLAVYTLMVAVCVGISYLVVKLNKKLFR